MNIFCLENLQAGDIVHYHQGRESIYRVLLCEGKLGYRGDHWDQYDTQWAPIQRLIDSKAYITKIIKAQL